MKKRNLWKSREKDCFGHLKQWKFHIFVSRKTGNEFRCDVINRVKSCPPLVHQRCSLDWRFCGREYLAEMSSDDGVMSLEDFTSTGSLMAAVETEILNRSALKPLILKRYIDDLFSIWQTNKAEVTQFIQQANNYHWTIELVADISYIETTFLDTCFQRWTIPKWFCIRNKKAFQTYWNISVHAFLQLPPFRDQKELHQGRSI